jgi:hypothetical protein
MPAMMTPHRQLAAWALVAYAGLHQVFAFFDWVLPGGAFGARSVGASFTSLVELALPLLGVLLATSFTPELPSARLITTVALAEYTVAVILGALAWLFGLSSTGAGGGARAAFDSLEFVTLGLLRLALAVIAGQVVYRTWVRLGGTLPDRIVRVR